MAVPLDDADVDVDVDVRRPLRRRRRLRNIPGEGERESCDIRLRRCSSSYVTSMKMIVGVMPPTTEWAGGGGDDSGIVLDDDFAVDAIADAEGGDWYISSILSRQDCPDVQTKTNCKQ